MLTVSLLPPPEKRINNYESERLSRSTPVSEANMYDSFGVSAYSYTGTWNENQTPNYFYDETARKSGNNYVLTSTYLWPNAKKMKFFAYAPQHHSSYELSGSSYAGSPTLSVTVPADVAKQQDLLVAQTGELTSANQTAVPLTFRHALTAIKFVCGDNLDKGTIKSISLKNVYSKGVFGMSTQKWSNVGTPATFSQTLATTVTGTEDEAITAEAQTFMMIPQTLPTDAQVEIVMADDSGTEQTLTADIGGASWPVGNTVVYKVSTSSINWTYTLNVTDPPIFGYTGGSGSYSVTSYRESNKGVKEAVAWSAQFSTDGGITWTNTRPSWLTAFTRGGNGGETARNYVLTISKQTDYTEVNNSHTLALQNATSKGSAATPYNLANQTNGGATNENTANCYVVGASGYYSFPLVYGNAIKNSATNTSAYNSTATGEYILTNFTNHTGNAITNPYIARNAGCVPASAELVWQDAKDLVTNIKYNNAGDGTISFQVGKSTICQGNAVIAIKDASGNVLWSWHIWVTDEDISQTIPVTNYQNVVYDFMPVNLGWCNERQIAYLERRCLVKFTAENQTRTITIRQAKSLTYAMGNNPYYQWGRKDPFLPAGIGYSDNKTWYDKDGNSSTSDPEVENISTNFIKDFILNPNAMAIDSNNGIRLYYNLWSVQNTGNTFNDNPVIKTIYDPCPVGFTVPASNAFTGFTATGSSATSSSDINGTWNSSFSLLGWNFYTNSSKDKTIFFPASGYARNRNDDGSLYGVGNGADYSVAIPAALNYNHSMMFDSRSVYPTNGNFWLGGDTRTSRKREVNLYYIFSPCDIRMAQGENNTTFLFPKPLKNNTMKKIQASRPAMPNE